MAYQPISPFELPVTGQKRCPHCGEWKPGTAEFFYSPPKARGRWFFDLCRVCQNIEHVLRHRHRRILGRGGPCSESDIRFLAKWEKWRAERAAWRSRLPESICCSTCNVTKPATLEHFHKGRVRGFRSSRCRPCERAYAKEQKRDWKPKSRAVALARRRRGSKTERARLVHKLYREKKRFQMAISSGVGGSLRRLGGRNDKRGRSWEKIVGYTRDELKVHLERQFIGHMSWENYGRVWHVDHIIPLASFKFTSADDPEFKAAWALTNLRPLWKKANMRKSYFRKHLL